MGAGAGAQALARKLSDERQFEAPDRAERLAKGLGWLSLGLGIAHLARPRAVSRFALGGHDRRKRDAMIAVGVREVAAGIGILTRRRPAGWLWARVAGDVIDLALLGASFRTKNTRSSHLMRSMAGVVGVTILDVVAGVQLSRGNHVATRGRRPLRVTKSITVNRPTEEVYRFWRNFQNLPRFMASLDTVQVRDERRSHWSVRGPGGTRFDWDAEIIEDRPNELISWQSLEGADVSNSGSVRFVRAPGGRGTEIHLELQYHPPGGFLGAKLAKLIGKAPQRQTEGDLRRFKQVIEAGEVVHSDASIHKGLHAARPPERQPERRGGAR
jgi:uncharacterized membrane protein